MPSAPLLHRSTSVRRVLTWDGDVATERDETLAGEEPLQIRACGPGQAPIDVAVTMRTPGNENELAAGFLVTEGLVRSADLAGVRFEIADPVATSQPENEITVRLASPFDASLVASRAFVATASCGICGKASIEDVERRCGPLGAGPRVASALIRSLPARMRDAQAVFESTGGLHAAALFNDRGELLELREDIGRHNALDKLVGTMALAGQLPLSTALLLVSGRASFEIVQKAAMAGIAFVCAVSAPSDLAVATAERLGMTLCGFLRGDRFNVYSRADRVVSLSA
jgi:FdhD protein